ncbi:MAG TPA: histidine kinase [Candidatus Limnocylindria bacterium]|jgi:signal transduction histidine kinase
MPKRHAGLIGPAVSAILAAAMLAVAAAYVVHRATALSDGTRGGYVTSGLSRDGMVVAPAPGASSTLEDGDTVRAVEGVVLESWARALIGLEPGPRARALVAGDTVAYQVERDGRLIDLSVPLGRYPVLASFAEHWATILFTLAMQIVAAYVFLRRPRDPAAGALLLMGTSLLASSIPWLLGFQALDLVSGPGFWLWVAAAFGFYAVFWMAVLHFAVVFPRPLQALTRWPWLVVALYAAPLAAQAALALITMPPSGSILDWMRGWTTVQLVAAGLVCLTSLTLVVVVYRWRADDTDRRRVRWIALAGGTAAAATVAFWIAPEFVFGRPLIPWSSVGIAGLGFPIAIGIAILRHQLFDIDVVISRSILYGGLTVGVAVVYGASVAILGRIMQQGGDFAIPLMATGIGALAMIPLYRWLSAAVGRVWPATAPAMPGLGIAAGSSGLAEATREGEARVSTSTAAGDTQPETPPRGRLALLLLNRTVVYGGLTAVVLAVYGISVAGLGSLLGGANLFGISLLATGLAAVVALPLRDELQGAVNRLLYGDRDAPYRAIARLGERLEASVPTQAVLPTIVETVAGALRLPYVAIELEREGQRIVAAATGAPRGKLLRVPLVHRAQRIGDLVLAPRSPADPFSAADRRLLTDLARQAGAAAQGVRLTAELQRSRERLVATREEERRRLRRELHDGLGPALAGALLKLAAARTKLATDPGTSEQLLTDVEQETRSAIDEVRRMARDLRPPALDELGLLSAVHEQARRFSSDGLEVAVSASGSLPPLSAAVEVAAYRIAREALTNVARHSRARHCRLEIHMADDALVLGVVDDGIGIGSDVQHGVGMASMHERAAELGGTLEVTAAPAGGTWVRAVLPLVNEA